VRPIWAGRGAFLMPFLIACTASRERLVRYSPEPADGSVVAEVYRAVLSGLAGSPHRDSVAIQAPDDIPPMDAMVSGGGIRLPSHWPDTLQHEANAALDNRTILADTAALGQAARAIRVVLLPSDTTAWPPRSAHPPPPRVRLSGPGFNADSTIAAVQVDYWCGPLCGSGQTLLLARKPGMRWRVWYALHHWIS
jgi:hypothetical protein